MDEAGADPAATPEGVHEVRDHPDHDQTSGCGCGCGCGCDSGEPQRPALLQIGAARAH